MGRPKKSDGPADRLAKFFVKSVAVGCGLWNASTESFVEGLEEEGVYISNVSIFEHALTHGWTYEDLHHLIGSSYKNGVRVALASDVIPVKEVGVKEGDNLIESDTQYYHSVLFDVIAPRFALTGTMMIPVSRGSATLKDKFTLRELMDYYYDNVKVACIAKRRGAETKTMAWLLTQGTLDEVLFAIDAAGFTDNEVPVVELTNYFDDARREIRYYVARSQ